MSTHSRLGFFGLSFGVKALGCGVQNLGIRLRDYYTRRDLEIIRGLGSGYYKGFRSRDYYTRRPGRVLSMSTHREVGFWGLFSGFRHWGVGFRLLAFGTRRLLSAKTSACVEYVHTHGFMANSPAHTHTHTHIHADI